MARADERGRDSESLEAPPHWWTGREEGRVAKKFPVAPVAATGRKGGPVPGEEPRAAKKDYVPEGRGSVGRLRASRVMDLARA